MKKIDFKRQNFVKDLFVPERVINSFDVIEFESYDIFAKCIADDLFYIEEKKYIFIPINKMSDYWNLVKIFNSTNICNQTEVYLLIKQQDILNKVFAGIVDKRFTVMIDKDLKINIGKYWNTEKGKLWISKNKLVKKIKIEYDHFDEQINEIICIYNEESIRFFLLDIDYKSFENMKMEEIHKLRYWINHLKVWMKLKQNSKLEIISSNFVKKIFVSNDLVLYITNKKKDSIWFFDLGKNLEEDGETMPLKTLNNLRKYMDLSSSAITSFFKIPNWFMIDFEQCREINESINEIPFVMGLFGRFLYDL